MDEEYSTSLRTITRDATTVRGEENANTIYGAKPQKNLLEDNQKGEGNFPLESRIVQV